IVSDRQIITSPVVQSAITGANVVIQGNFTESSSKDLATQLNSGALPVQLTRQQVSTVSPTLGSQSLHQSLVAALVGLMLLMLYLAFYYRLLGIVTWFGMTIWGTFALALVSILGHSAGYSLTLAGVAALVMALGVT